MLDLFGLFLWTKLVAIPAFETAAGQSSSPRSRTAPPATVVRTALARGAVLETVLPAAPPPAPEGADKLVHLVAFVALAFPLARTGRFGLIPVLIGASAFGAIIELIQPTFNRSADLNDWVADTLGVLIGIGLGLAYRRVRQRRS